MKKLAIIAAGGVVGSLFRYLFIDRSDEIGILAINLIGVAIAGFIAYRIAPGELSRAFWIPGVAGSMTTFSSVAVVHGQRNDLLAIAYFYAMVAISLLVVLLIAPRQRTS